MSSFLSSRPFAVILHRPILRAFFFLLVFGTFFAIFLPPTHAPHINTPHFRRPKPVYTPTFAPPQLGSHRHRIKAQRPLTRPDHHRNGDVWAGRADAVRDAFLHAYNSYVTYAAPHDELLPLSKGPVDTSVFFILRHGHS